MSRLIDADKLMSQVVKKKPEVAKARYTEGFNDAILKVRSMIHSAATYEAIEVVRCKDCKNRYTENCLVMFWDCGELMGETQDNDFCSYGERREG